jgi:hypothetical protein
MAAWIARSHEDTDWRIGVTVSFLYGEFDKQPQATFGISCNDIPGDKTMMEKMKRTFEAPSAVEASL